MMSKVLSQSTVVPALVTTTHSHGPSKSSTKISRSSRIRSFSGLRVLNSLDNMVKFGQDLTPKVAISMDVVKLAKAKAKRLGHNFIGREEILVGIIVEGSNIAAKVLSSMGINLRDARVEVENIVGRGSGVVTSDVPYTLYARCALELSMEVSLQLGHKYIRPEHFLLGLLRETEGVAARILENLGADLRKIGKEVIRKITEIEAASVKKMSMPTLEDLIKPTKLEVKQIANIMLQEVIDRLKGKEIKLQVKERFRERVVEEGYDPSYGARPLRRAIMRLLEDSMEGKILDGKIKEGDSRTVDIDSDGNIMVFNGQ